MQVTNIKIENFKRFALLDVDLKAFDCLVGSNNSGKTTLLQALALFDFCIHNCLSQRNGSALIEIKNRSIAPDEFYVLPIANPIDLWTDRRTQARSQHIIIRIQVTFFDRRQVTAKIDLSFNRLAVSLEMADQSQEWLRELAGFKASYLPVFSTFLPQEERRTPAVIADELARGRVNGVIRNLLLDLHEEKRDLELVEILQRSFPDLKNISIEFDQLNDRYIQVTYQEKDRPKSFDIFSAGSGFQQFIYLFGFILLRQPGVILLDEPDVHLHGALQNALLNEMRLLVAQGKQVIFATHSSDLIRQMNPEEMLILESGDARRLQVAFDIYDTLDRLGSVEQTQLPVVQAYRRVVVVENKDDWNLLTIFCSKILGSRQWQLIERRLAVCYAHGNPYRQDMQRLRQQLQQMITAGGGALELFIISDRDYYPDLDVLYDKLKRQHLHWHIWERTEIENYLLVDAAVARVLNLDEEPLLSAPMLEAWQRLIESSRNQANDALVKAHEEYSRDTKAGWDAVTFSRKAREYLEQHWTDQKLALVDAKEVVLPGIKRWAQEQGIGQFSEKALANTLLPHELPPEVHELAQRLAEFAGVRDDT